MRIRCRGPVHGLKPPVNKGVGITKPYQTNCRKLRQTKLDSFWTAIRDLCHRKGLSQEITWIQQGNLTSGELVVAAIQKKINICIKNILWSDFIGLTCLTVMPSCFQMCVILGALVHTGMRTSMVPDLNYKSMFHRCVKVMSCSIFKVGIWVYEAKCKYTKL